MPREEADAYCTHVHTLRSLNCRSGHQRDNARHCNAFEFKCFLGPMGQNLPSFLPIWLDQYWVYICQQMEIKILFSWLYHGLQYINWPVLQENLLGQGVGVGRCRDLFSKNGLAVRFSCQIFCKQAVFKKKASQLLQIGNDGLVCKRFSSLTVIVLKYK